MAGDRIMGVDHRTIMLTTLLSITALAAGCSNVASSTNDGAAAVADGASSPADPASQSAALPVDWTESISTTADGGYLIGNPRAPVKVVEYASLTCPHCREFHLEAMQGLKRDYVASGGVAYEFRNFILNGADLAASMLARCGGPQDFFPRVNQFFEKQQEWGQRFSTISAADRKRIEAQPEALQLATYARLGGLEAFVQPLGIPASRFSQCLSDKTSLDRLMKMREEAVTKYQINGTPSFLLNGQPLEGTYSWGELRLKLDALIAEPNGSASK